MYSQFDMFRVHTPIIRSIVCWVAAYGFLHRDFWMGGGLESRCVGRVYGAVGTRRAAPSAPYTRPTQRLSRLPSIQKLDAENRMLQLNIYCHWWWGYVPETCRAKNMSIKLTSFIKLAFHFISWGRCTVKQPSKTTLSISYIHLATFFCSFNWFVVNLMCGWPCIVIQCG
jgi:hypothetical protein